MTVQTIVRKARFVGNGVTTAFPFSFKCFAATDLSLTQTSVAGVDSTVNSLYSITLNTDQENNPGGTITYPTSGPALASGVILTLTSNQAATQLTDLTNAGGFFPKTITDRFDYLTILIQQALATLATCLTGSASDPTPSFSLGTAAQRALKYLAFDGSGNVSLATSLPSGTLSRASIAGFLYPQTAAEVLAGVTPSDYSYPSGDIRRYNAKCDGVADDLTAINNAILVVNKQGGGIVTAPGATIFHSAGITMLPLVQLHGAGKAATTFLSSHVGNGITTTSPINASSGVYTHIRDCRFTNTNASNTGGGIVDIGGTMVSLQNVSVIGFAYSVIWDQTELSDAYLCEFIQFATGGVWLTNGADHTTGANKGFTNRNSVRSCQINGYNGVSLVPQGVGIIDDGGVTHSFVDNNFNACVNHMRICGNTAPGGPGTEVYIQSNEFEAASGNCIVFANTTSVLGTARGVTTAATIDTNFFSPVSAFSVLIPAAAVYALRFTNNRCISSAATVSGTANLNSLFATGNTDSNAGALFDGIAGGSHVEQATSNTTTTIKNTNIQLTGAVAVTGAIAGSSTVKGTVIGATTAAVSFGAGTVAIGGTTATTVGAAGGATALPATPLGYIIANVAGTQVKIPYYNN